MAAGLAAALGMGPMVSIWARKVGGGGGWEKGSCGEIVVAVVLSAAWKFMGSFRRDDHGGVIFVACGMADAGLGFPSTRRVVKGVTGFHVYAVDFVRKPVGVAVVLATFSVSFSG